MWRLSCPAILASFHARDHALLCLCQTRASEFRRKAACRPWRSVAALVLERELELHAVRQLAPFDVDVLLDDLGHAQVPERLRGLRDGHGGGLLPRLSAAPHERDHLVDAVWHDVLLFFESGPRPQALADTDRDILGARQPSGKEAIWTAS